MGCSRWDLSYFSSRKSDGSPLCWKIFCSVVEVRGAKMRMFFEINVLYGKRYYQVIT